MKVALNDLLKGQRKAGSSVFAEKIAAQVAIDAKEPTEEEVEKGAIVKTFVLSPTGGEIHRGEPVVDRISKPETLRQKIARFERLAQKVKENRMYMLNMLQESIGDGTEDADDDFDFEDGDFVDDFGDVVEPIKPVEKPVESGDGDGEEPAAPNSQAGEKPSDEPDEDPAN